MREARLKWFMCRGDARILLCEGVWRLTMDGFNGYSYTEIIVVSCYDYYDLEWFVQVAFSICYCCLHFRYFFFLYYFVLFYLDLRVYRKQLFYLTGKVCIHFTSSTPYLVGLTLNMSSQLSLLEEASIVNFLVQLI